eukprot:3155941-Lingulodinium_polyedra.AAC.1
MEHELPGSVANHIDGPAPNVINNGVQRGTFPSLALVERRAPVAAAASQTPKYLPPPEATAGPNGLWTMAALHASRSG